MISVLSVNLGKSKTILHQDRLIETGIYKSPSAGPVRVDQEGVIGDVQVDRKNHGGPDKALYAYSWENYHYWAKVRGEDLYDPGHFGENLTASNLADDAVHIGDIFAVGETLLQVTQPRVPCFKLGLKFGDPGFVGEFLTSGRTGFYLRVLEQGEIRAGNSIHRVSEDKLAVTISDAMKALIKVPDQRLWIKRVLAVESLSSAWREDLERRLSSRQQQV